jgi:hypothetical protein
MYDITKTRMLLTTAVFAAVAALFAGGANARILDESGSASGAQASIGIGVDAAQPPSWQGKGGKGEETESGTALAVVQDDGGYASPGRLQSGHGPAGPTAGTVLATETTGGGTYGSAALLQLGHGPGGPATQR